MMGHHPPDHHRPLPLPPPPSSSSPLTLTDAGVGPTCCNSRPNEVMSGSNIYIRCCQYDDKVAEVSATISAAVGHYTFQPFDISSTTTTTTSISAFKSPAGGGGMAAADLGFPFTWAQWKELERQAMIYKYMTASIPVPPDLLLPIARSLSSTNPNSMGNANGYLKLGLPSNNKEAEIGRCKRTDGKKWRCSRDVAPHQKYCERHLNRGRPRSRKPVEVVVVQQPEPPTTFDNMINKKTRFDNHNLLPNPENLHSSTTSSHGFLRSNPTLHPNGFPLFLDHRPDEDLSVSSYKDLTRGLDWTRPELNLNPYTDYGVTPYTDFGASEPEPETERISLQSQNQMETGRGFIDAWSDKDTNKKPNNSSVVSSQSHLWPSCLTLSMAMAAGNTLDEEMGQIGMGLRPLGVGDSEESEIHKARVLSWLSPVSYDVGSSAPGGPLAEMLRPSGMAACSDSNGMSSPSEVLQKTLLSLSDSSGCTSPSVAVPEMIMPFQWLN